MQRLESFFLRFDWKKTTLLLTGFLCILIFFLLFSSFRKNSTNKTSTKNTPSVPQSEYRYIAPDSSFSFIYPISWTTVVRPVAGGGTSILLHPSDKTAYFPELYIESSQFQASGSSSIDSRIKNLINLYHSPLVKQIQFQGYPAEELDINLSLTFVSPAINQKPITKTFIFSTYGTRLYVIEYAYYNDEKKDQAKNSVNKILSTFQFPNSQ